MESSPALMALFTGWDGYRLSLVRAIAPRTPAELAFRIRPDRRSVGETAAHIALGRVDWFHRMGAAGAAELAAPAACWDTSSPPEAALAGDAAAIVTWLEDSWQMVAANLGAWTVADLDASYLQAYQGQTYAVSRQWTIWRILAHDIHHGGQLTVLLGAQGIDSPDLGAQGGHLTVPPRAPPSGLDPH